MKNKTEILYPPKVGKIILTTSFAVHIIFGILRDYYFDFDLLDMTVSEAKLEYYLRLVHGIGFMSAISSMISKAIGVQGNRGQIFILDKWHSKVLFNPLSP